jgi:endo-1,4-beta-xylanase
MTKKTPTITLLLMLLSCASSFAQTDEQKTKKQKNKKAAAEFKWNNPSTKWFKKKFPLVQHHTFNSPTLEAEVGYCIYLPPNYDANDSKEVRYPVVYYLHGGRPGSEWKGARLSNAINPHIVDGSVAPMIYVFVNGGPVSHYNMPGKPKAQGADVFIKELIPHIDATYRTIATRVSRKVDAERLG